MRIFKIYIFLVCGLLPLSCGKDKDDLKSKSDVGEDSSSGGISAGGVQFKIKYDKPRQIYKIESVDLDNNGKD